MATNPNLSQSNGRHSESAAVLLPTSRLNNYPATIRGHISPHPSGCWNWNSHLDRDGYGKCTYKGKTWRAHRLVFVLEKGAIENQTLDHLCRNRRCVNPAHLEPVSIRTNTLRGTSFAAINAQRTHCPAGHLYDGLNLYKYGNRRLCKECNRVAVRKYKARKRGQP